MSTENSKDVSATAEDQKQSVADESQEKIVSQKDNEQRPVPGAHSDARPAAQKPATSDSQRKENIAVDQSAGQTGPNTSSTTQSASTLSPNPRSSQAHRQSTASTNPGGYRSSVTVERKKKMAAAVSQRKALQLPGDMKSPTEVLNEPLPPEMNLETPVPEEIKENLKSTEENETSRLQNDQEHKTERGHEVDESRKKPMSEPETLQDIPSKEKDHSSDEEKRKMEHDFEEMISTFVIPDNIDPVLLEVWMRREKEDFFKKRRGEDKPSLPISGRKGSFAMVFASYLSVLVMIILILFGMINGTHPEILLKKVFLMMICFFIIGYLVGAVVDKCISESAREMIRELIQRSQESQEAKNVEMSAANTASP